MNSGSFASPTTIEQDKKGKRKRGPTGMKEINCVSSEGRRRVVEYNEHDQPFGQRS